MDKYQKDCTYLVFERVTKEFLRWSSDKTLFFASNVNDALVGLPKNEYVAIEVASCSEEIQREYEAKINSMKECEILH
jgi:hypothetical protein